MYATVSCPMDFHRYPRDVIICRLDFKSYSNDLKKVIYEWDSDAIPVNPHLKILQYYLSIDTKRFNKTNLEGEFSVVQAIFTFKRQISNKLFQVFLPSLQVVGMSWLSFWISLKTIGTGRINLLLICLLAITSQVISVRKELPPLSYITLMDVWMLGCMIFVFSSTFEFGIVKYFESIHEKHLEENKKQKPIEMTENESDPDFNATHNQNQREMYMTSVQKYGVPGYMQYLNLVVQNHIKLDLNKNKVSHISETHIFAPNYWNPVSNQHKNEVKSTENRNPRDDQTIHNEVVWFKIIDRKSRVYFPVAFAIFTLIYSWLLFLID